MSTLITTDSFACRIELSTVKKRTTHLPCTQNHPMSSVCHQLLDRHFQKLQCYSMMTAAVKRLWKPMEFA